jgi:hypothetical protein
MALGLLIAVALLGAEGWVLWHVLCQQGRLLMRLEALETALPMSGLAPHGPVATALTEPPVSTPASVPPSALIAFPAAALDRAPAPLSPRQPRGRSN